MHWTGCKKNVLKQTKLTEQLKMLQNKEQNREIAEMTGSVLKHKHTPYRSGL